MTHYCMPLCTLRLTNVACWCSIHEAFLTSKIINMMKPECNLCCCHVSIFCAIVTSKYHGATYLCQQVCYIKTSFHYKQHWPPLLSTHSQKYRATTLGSWLVGVTFIQRTFLEKLQNYQVLQSHACALVLVFLQHCAYPSMQPWIIRP